MVGHAPYPTCLGQVVFLVVGEGDLGEIRTVGVLHRRPQVELLGRSANGFLSLRLWPGGPVVRPTLPRYLDEYPKAIDAGIFSSFQCRLS